MLWQPTLPDRYLTSSEADLAAAIAARRRELGSRLLILGHHYQQDEVIRHADLTGDSLRLSRLAAEEARRIGSEFIVFCGVHFMAETADLLTDESVAVVLPDLSAGCSMADMAQWDEVVEAWESIEAAHRASGERVRVVPITYVNCSAAIKAFVGARGGACCTSSNAAAVFDWALAGGATPLEPGERVQVLFLPDQHLGRNTAKRRGFTTEVDAARDGGPAETALWDPRKALGGLDEAAIASAKVLLWAGHCSVHKLFRPEHVEEIRGRGDGTRSPRASGVCAGGRRSRRSRRIDRVHHQGDRAGAVGFEVGRRHRGASGLAAREGGRRAEVDVRILSDCQCLCTTMYRIDQPHLLWVLDHLAEGRVVNRISVHREARADAVKALERMLSLVENPVPAAAVD